MSRRSPDNGGAVLVEALVATVVLAVALVLVVRSVLMPVQAVSIMENRETALGLLRETISQIRLNNELMPELVTGATNDIYTINADGICENESLRTIRVTVNWVRKNKAYELSTVMALHRNREKPGPADE